MILPTNRAPTHPGEILLEEFLAPLRLTPLELAERTGVPVESVSRIVAGHEDLAADTAVRLSRLFGTSPDFWLNLQRAWDQFTQKPHDDH